jgi:hypothetical protein
LQSRGAAQADRPEIIVERACIRPRRGASADTVRDEFHSRLLQDLSDPLKRDRCDPLASVRPLEPADGDDRDVGALGNLGLLKAQESTGGADLFGGDVHERKISQESAFVQSRFAQG